MKTAVSSIGKRKTLPMFSIDDGVSRSIPSWNIERGKKNVK